MIMIIKVSLKISLAVFFLLILLSNLSSITFATTCSLSNATISTGCSFADTNIYLDAGTGTTNTFELQITNGATLSLTDGQTLYVPKIKVNGGIITSVGTTKINFNEGVLAKWMLDEDEDGYPSSTEIQQKSAAPTSDWKRLNTILSKTIIETGACSTAPDRNPGETGVWHTTISSDSSWDFDCDGIVTQRYTSPFFLSQKYICNTTGCAAHYYTIKDGWTTSTSTPACGVADTYKKTTGQSSTNCAVLDTVATCANTVTSASITQGCY